MERFSLKDMPLRRKITLIATVSASLSLLTACFFFILNERITFP